MSFNGYKETIDEGDTVVIFLSVNHFYTLVVKKESVFQTKYGALKHNDLLGKTFGTQVTCSKGWVYILHPTPELWTLTLPHRTQILYTTDISVIVLQLDLRPGSVVCESGTGSGSLSHALIRTIAPTGHLHTFDFHEERVRLCQEEFEAHGVAHLVTVRHRDVVRDGFDLENAVDAVFLDLPLPWEAIPAAKKAMKSRGGRFCSFSPCIEQVQKTCEGLRRCGFTEIVTMECVQRLLDVRTITMPVCNLDPNTEDATATESATKKSPAERESGSETSAAPPSIKPQDDDDDDDDDSDGEPEGEPEGTTGRKRKNKDRNDKAGKKKVPGCSRRRRDQCRPGPSATFREGVPPLQQVGHTGYLTFATLYPCWQSDRVLPHPHGEPSSSRKDAVSAGP